MSDSEQIANKLSKKSEAKDSFRDRVATVDAQGKRVWLFPQRPKGPLYNARKLLSYLYLLVFVGLPFIKVQGHPLFLANVIERRFILFGQIFWPQDFFIFAMGMLVFIVFVTLFTVVFGRVFCGWICPQTVFMEMIFRRIEYFFEGDAAQQKMLAKAPWTVDKWLRKSGKWICFAIMSILFANTFLAYIIGVDELQKIVTEPVSSHLGGFAAMLIFSAVFFFIYNWFREQVCTVVCPYGRLQGVLLDKNSMVVAYDYLRGEQRGKFKKNEPRDLGDCIDCNQCVKVCPTGIDIRNGTQMECINCTACIDACNFMMEAVGLDRGLIRIASENQISKKEPWKFNTRIKAYSVVMLLLLGLETTLLATRSDIGATVIRTSGQLYQEREGEKLSNLYNYKFINKTYADKDIELRAENFQGEIQLIGAQKLHVTKGDDISGEFFVILDKKQIHDRKTDLKLGVYENNKRISTLSTTFVGPFINN
jgi:cytochrome c oxidase accessory protein FixG